MNREAPKVPGCDCCSFCAMDCKCEGDCTKFPFLNLIYHENFFPVLPKTTMRNILLVRKMILEYIETAPPSLAPPGIVTGLTATCIENIINHLPYIDSFAYLKEYVDIRCSVLLIISDVFSNILVPEENFLHMEIEET